VYYVRLASGDEKTYRTVEEMVWDVELGVITRDARIFHPNTKEWVQVTRHPQLVSRFVSEEGQADEVGLDFDLLSDDEIKGLAPKPAEVPPPAPLIITDISVETAQQQAAPPIPPAEGLAPAVEFISSGPPEPIAPPRQPEPVAAAAAPTPPPRAPTPPPRAPAPPTRVPTPLPASYLPEPLPLDGELAPLPDDNLDTTEYKPLEWKPEPRFRGLALAGGVIAVVALLGAGGWFGWQWWSSRPTRTVMVVQKPGTLSDTALARQQVDSVSDRDLAAALSTLAAAETAGVGPRGLGRPGRLIPGSTAPTRAVEGLRPMTPIELRRSYAAAYAAARTAMDSDLALAGVSKLFATSRLSSRDSLRSGRRLITAARNVVRVYHSDEVQIERAYRDTVAFQVARMGWSRTQQEDWKARAELKESYEGSEVTDSLLTYTDNLYALLLGDWGQYELSGSTIGFDNAAAAQDYQELAGWLQTHIARFESETESSSSSPTARRIARALGGTRPPTLRRSRVPD
jgi:hypothetical protein